MGRRPLGKFTTEYAGDRREGDRAGISFILPKSVMFLGEKKMGEKKMPKLAPLVRELSWKDHEVVEYALSRTVSPALVAEYETKLPDKRLLQAKLHEFYQIAKEQMEEDE
jgi:hypothetical protein